MSARTAGPPRPVGHVALFHPSPSALGGSQTSMRAEARALVATGWHVSIVHGQLEGLDPELAELSRGDLLAGDLFGTHPEASMLRALRRLDSWLATEDPDICHVHMWNHPLLVSRLAAVRPTVATAHLPVCPNGARFQYKPERLCEHAVGPYCLTTGYRRRGCGTRSDGETFGVGRFVLSLGYAKLSLRALARCDRVIAPSGWQKEMLVGDGVPPGRVAVVPPPIETFPYSARAGPSGSPVVLTAGRLSVIKGVHHLLEASALVTARHVIEVAGEGPHRQRLVELARRLDIDDRVRFLGQLSPAQLRDAYAGAAVVVVPSLWPETFGMVGPEALVSGTPVVAYLSGGVRDWAPASTAVTAVQPGDIAGLAAAIDAVITRGEGLGPEGRTALGERLSPHAHASAIDALYREAIDERLGRATG